MEQGHGADSLAFHAHVLQHFDGFRAGDEREELELFPDFLIREGRDVRMLA